MRKLWCSALHSAFGLASRGCQWLSLRSMDAYLKCMQLENEAFCRLFTLQIREIKPR